MATKQRKAPTQNTEQTIESATTAALGGASQEMARRVSEAVNIHVEGYLGGTTSSGRLTGLRDAKRWKPPADDRQMSNQAGKVGEVLHRNRENAERALRGDSNRVGLDRDVGLTNDKTFDIVERRQDGTPRQSKGKVVGDQLKLGRTAENTTNEITKKIDQYGDARKILVPKDQVEQVKANLRAKAEQASKDAAKARQQGDLAKAKEYSGLAKKLNQSERKVEASQVTTKEAIAARKNPELTTAKEALKSAHKGGVQAAKTGAMIGGGMSAAQNIMAVRKGEKELSEAVVDTVVDTAKAAGVSYATVTAGGTIKALLEQAGKSALPNVAKKTATALSKGNLPVLIVTTSIEFGKSLKRYAAGEIDAKQLGNELVNSGVGVAGSAVGANVGAAIGGAIGAALGTITLPGIGTFGGKAVGMAIGGFNGSMVGYVVSTQLFQAAKNLLAGESSIDTQRRARLMALCEAAQATMEQELAALDALIDQYYAERRAAFVALFTGMRDAIFENDPDGITDNLEGIARMFGGSLTYKDEDEFDEFMLDKSAPLKLSYS